MNEIIPDLSALPALLLPWFQVNQRELPWRNDREPYHIWLSEIMLQQTRVEAVRGYYQRFLQALPTVEMLAEADDGLLTKLWEGLGYYSRVRNLKKAARIIVHEYGGAFPRSYDRLLQLPGIGAYTAGAIASIAFGEKTPAVDGNVLRVYSRLADDHTPIDLPAFKKLVSDRLAAVYPEEAGTFTQALMELGATICGPNRKPACGSCPCRQICLGYQRGTAGSLPVKNPKKQRKTQHKTVLILACEDALALEKRPDKGLLAGLWQFPNYPGHLSLEEVLDILRQKGLSVTEVVRQTEKTHIFTHVQWEMRGYYLQVSEPLGGYVWMDRKTIEQQAALPTAFRIFYA